MPVKMSLGRRALATLGRAFGGAAGKPERFDAGNPGGRRLAAIPSTTVAINSLVALYGRTLIGRSRYLCTNNSYALSAKEKWISAMVGAGIKPSALGLTPEQKLATQELWRDWTDEADWDNQMDFYGLQGIIAAELFEAGEVFVRIRKAPKNLTVPFKLQVLPSEMLPYWESRITSNHVELGIEFDGKGQRQAYHFYRRHPGDLVARPADISATELIRVPAGEVMHLMLPGRAGQLRGIPRATAPMSRLAMLDLYDDAELERKRTTALFAAFVTKPASDDEDDHPLGPLDAGPLATTMGNDQFNMEGGAIIDLNPGELVEFSAPADVGSSYDPFQYRNLTQIAAGFGVPYASMTGDLMKANYGSIRAGLVEFRRNVERLQHAVMVRQLCAPVWSLFMVGATLRPDAPWSPSEYMANSRKMSRVKWIPPRWDWVDPKKDREAEKIAVDNGFKSRDDVIEEEGYDPEEMDARIAASQQRAADLGLVLALPEGTAPEPDPADDPSWDPDEPEEPDDAPAGED
jgi:lambda family phage portal protein